MLDKYKRDLKASEKCENIDAFLTVYVNEPLGLLFAKLFIKLKMSPNAVTTLSMLTGVAGAVCLIFNKVWLTALAIFLIFISAVFDCSDGQVARLTKKGSPYGRMYDGFADGVVYTSIYLGLGIRLMQENIPFTSVKWGWWVWILVFAVAVYFHGTQARMADYYRNAHMYFASMGKSHELSRSYKVKRMVDEQKGFKKFMCLSYLSYTKSQEKYSRKFQKLMDKIDDLGYLPEEIANCFYDESKKVVKLTNALTFNLRTAMLYILLAFNVEVFIFAFILLCIEPIKIFLIVRYEKISEKCLNTEIASIDNQSEVANEI